MRRLGRMLVLAALLLSGSGAAGWAQSAKTNASSTGGGGFLALGVHEVALDALNTRLRSEGYPTVSTTLIAAGGADTALWAITSSSVARATGLLGPRAPRVDGQLPPVGATAYSRWGTSFGPRRAGACIRLGLGGGAVQLDIGSTGAESFDDVLRDPNQSATLTRGQLLVSLGAGADTGSSVTAERAGFRLEYAPDTCGCRPGPTGNWETSRCPAARTPRWAGRSFGCTSEDGATDRTTGAACTSPPRAHSHDVCRFGSHPANGLLIPADGCPRRRQRLDGRALSGQWGVLHGVRRRQRIGNGAGGLVGATGTLQNAGAVLTDSVQARLDRARNADSVISVVDRTGRGVGIATEATPEGDSTLTWQFAAEQVRDVAVGASKQFVWDATSTETGTGRSMIHAFYRPEKAPWRRSAEFAQFTVAHLSDTVLPYPYPQMTTIEGPIGGGIESLMVTLMGDLSSSEALFGVTYHEISHMWFPMLVGTNEKKYAWLDEGTTTFNETEGRSAFYPDQNAWVRSEHNHRSVTFVEIPSMRHADRYPVDGPARFVASYDKPGVMLHALRGILGAETFREAYRMYAERWTYEHPTPYDFFNTFEDVAGRELDWFWRGAFYESWTMDHAIQSVSCQGDSTVVTVADEGRLPMPVFLKATYADGRTVERRVDVDAWLNGRRQVEVVLEGESVSRVVLNPDGVLPDLYRSNNEWTPSAPSGKSESTP